ncbi:hypothetical protein VHEMI04641 [[Torrubiella] hemipterigena]|uniref:Amine oxidase domain-containing protein n=1 Tax=[Torrubiella] hemipterigena TaxID=1531966 RepID=A0A0A1T1U9_9HYPO|nr:hypothetical protein VHEMI04641 [[Torrubiella] hemipterigena]
MHSKRLTIAALSLGSVAAAYDWSTFAINNNEWHETIERDVCIVGGGSSGVHAAVQLKDLNRTVAIVERKSVLGGHTNTFTEPETLAHVDYGVLVFHPLSVTYDYFGRFDIPLFNLTYAKPNEPGQPCNKSLPYLLCKTTRSVIDFRDGSPVNTTKYTDFSEARERYIKATSQYPYLLDGYDIPDPVPEDLYMPFGDFVEKYSLQAIFSTAYLTAQGLGDMLHVPAIYAIKYFNTIDAQTLVGSSYVTTVRRSTYELYEKAGKFIGKDNLFMDSSIISTRRQNTTSGRLELLITSKDQSLSLLSCRQVISTIPPQVSNLDGWDLSDDETSVFSKFTKSNGYWAGLVTNVGLNQTRSWLNAAANTPFNIPVLPAMYEFRPIGVVEGLWAVKFAANTAAMTDEQVKDYVIRQIQTIQKSVGAPVTEPRWVAFDSHSPFSLYTSPEDIKHGFYKSLNGLQGGFGGKMFYSGAAFHVHNSAMLWRYNQEVLIPQMRRSW